MANPQQPEIARSRKTSAGDEDAAAAKAASQEPPSKGNTGPVPPDNRPGHHPDVEQDKPEP